MIKTTLRWIGRALLLAIGLVLLYQVWIFGRIWWWVDHNPSDSAFMSARREVLQEKKPNVEIRYRWVPSSTASPIT